jgi:hypothetical protein
MNQEQQFILQRANATLAVQTQTAGVWLWEEKALAQRQVAIAAIAPQDEVQSVEVA